MLLSSGSDCDSWLGGGGPGGPLTSLAATAP